MTEMERLQRRLRERLGADRVQVDVPLAPLTTFRIGGRADCLVTASGTEDVRHAIACAREAGAPVTLFGGGSNVLVADEGIRGVVIRMHGGQVRQTAAERVRADAGVTMNGLVRWTITHGLAGLEAWAGTPGTVGGAIYGNAHFQGRNVSELVATVELLTPAGDVIEAEAGDMVFAYDFSRVQQTGEVVLAADFRAGAGEPEALRAVARESLAYRKRTQPLALSSAGCVFQNPDPQRVRLPPGVPCSAGALVDRAGLKGSREGRARVSPVHGNFIVNEGGATAADVQSLIERCRDAVRREFGINLRDEIVRLGFEREPAGRAG